MRIALAQINPTIGDLQGNTEIILRDIEKAKQNNADLVVFPELAIPGYPPKDLLLREGFVEQCLTCAELIASECQGIAAAVGLPTRSQTKPGTETKGGAQRCTFRGLHNSLAFCTEGKIARLYHKRLLPTYDVFDEDRYFDPGNEVVVIELKGLRIGLSICEDLWRARDVTIRRDYACDPLDELSLLKCDIVINPSASPFVLEKPARQRELLQDTARHCGSVVIHVNQAGGQDELIFPGHSAASNAEGKIIAEAPSFSDDLVLVDTPGQPVSTRNETTEEQVFSALRLGVSDYCHKCGFQSAVLGLSGGIDSALVAVIAAAAIGAENVLGISMPSRYSSPGSKDDARELAERTGIRFDTIPILEMHQAVERSVFPHFPPNLPPDVTEENVQSRLRGLTLMAFSNKLRSLLLTTGNKSEMAVGYCTLYGDMAGGLAVLSDVPKTLVYRLSRWINENYKQCGFVSPPIPEPTITKPPSAELRPDQKDTDSLPPYEILDEIIARYVEQEQSVERIIRETGFDRDIVEKFTNMIDRNEHKRKQAPIGIKITHRAFGFGRRFPIVQNYRPLDGKQ